MSEAAFRYRLAAEKGNSQAEFSIGELYLRGWGMPRDEIDAPRWIETAANGVEAENQPRMGWQAAEGYGMPQDFEQAAYWFQRAAEKGRAEAEYQLGRLYAQGHGLPHDEKEAAKWVEEAASQGHALAQARLGMRYADGRGVEQDPAQGYFWLTLAARQETTGEKTRTALAAKLGPAAASRVESAAKRWVPARPAPQTRPEAAKW